MNETLQLNYKTLLWVFGIYICQEEILLAFKMIQNLTMETGKQKALHNVIHVVL